MKFQTTLVWINSVVFFLYGLSFIFLPEALANLVTNTVPGGSSGLIDMRATYGGMSLGLGVLLGILANNPSFVRVGLWGVLSIMVGMASARLLGIFVDGTPNSTMYVYLASEILMAMLVLLALKPKNNASRF